MSSNIGLIGKKLISLDLETIKNSEKILIPCQERNENLLYFLYAHASQRTYKFFLMENGWTMRDDENSFEWTKYKEYITEYIVRHAEYYEFEFSVYRYNMEQTDPEKIIQDEDYFTPYITTMSAVEVEGESMYAIGFEELKDVLYSQSNEIQDRYPKEVYIMTIGGLNYSDYLGYQQKKIEENKDKLVSDNMNSPVIRLYQALLTDDAILFFKEESGTWFISDKTHAFNARYNEIKTRVDILLDFIVDNIYNTPFTHIFKNGNGVRISLFYLTTKLGECADLFETSETIDLSYTLYINMCVMHILLFDTLTSAPFFNILPLDKGENDQ